MESYFFIAIWKKNKRQSLVWAVRHHLVSMDTCIWTEMVRFFDSLSGHGKQTLFPVFTVFLPKDKLVICHSSWNYMRTQAATTVMFDYEILNVLYSCFVEDAQIEAKPGCSDDCFWAQQTKGTLTCSNHIFLHSNSFTKTVHEIHYPKPVVLKVGSKTWGLWHNV